MRTLKIGIASYEQMKARTLETAQGRRRARRGDPTVWFTSVESFAKVLSERNRALLSLIAEAQPESLAELRRSPAAPNPTCRGHSRPWNDMAGSSSARARVESSFLVPHTLESSWLYLSVPTEPIPRERPCRSCCAVSTNLHHGEMVRIRARL
jgi:hypothetical protein